MAQVEAKTAQTGTGTGLSLKLVIDVKSNRVMFAEAGKDVIDFLFSLLQMPLGSVVRLLTSKDMVGCIGNLYDSVQGIGADYFQSDVYKDMILKSKIVSVPLSHNANLLTVGDGHSEPVTKQYYKCIKGNYHSYETQNVTEIYGSVCPDCFSMMMVKFQFARPSKDGKGIVNAAGDVAGAAGKGYVKELVVYMVMDDLSVVPMSTVLGLTLLNKFGVEDIRSLQEKTVAIGVEQGLELLKASFESKTVLTDIFLSKEKDSKRKKCC